jgi:hypothetical protein
MNNDNGYYRPRSTEDLERHAQMLEARAERAERLIRWMFFGCVVWIVGAVIYKALT